jgi:uncharacterized OB-fold protein
MTDGALPVADIDSSPWWAALQRRELLVQCCKDCRRLRWPGREVCNDCGSRRWGWVPATGAGSVASWTVTHRSGAVDAGQFVVALVRLDDQDDILIPGYIDGPPDGAGLNIGMRVAVGFDEVDVGQDGWRHVVIRWRRTDQ